MDLLFTKDRSIWVFRDAEATKIGAFIERDLSRGQALADFDGALNGKDTVVEIV